MVLYCGFSMLFDIHDDVKKYTYDSQNIIFFVIHCQTGILDYIRFHIFRKLGLRWFLWTFERN